MARQLIICCDGTNNNLTGRRNDTNVTQLCELLEPEAQNQLLYYDPGVGNPGELPGASIGDQLSRRYERLHGLVFGKGIYENIEEAYRFIMRNWTPDDEIFLFGFSRGAFTARSVGGLVTQFGILRPDMEGLIPTLLHTYFSNREKDEKARKEYQAIKAQIKALYSDAAARDAPVWFVGVWDTVASVGAPLFSREITATPTIVGKNFHHVRQALSLDEYRRNFLPRPYLIEAGYDYAEHGQSIRQQWFSGAHCDVGGGYKNSEAGLSQQTLLWMVQEAAAPGCGLRLRQDVRNSDDKPDPALITHFLDTQSSRVGRRHRLVHSETYDSPLWALGGQVVRNPHDTQKYDRPVMPPVESPTVLANDRVFPSSTVWRKARLFKPVHRRSRRSDPSRWNYLTHPLVKVTIAVLAAIFFWFVTGALLLGPSVIQGDSLWQQMGSMFRSLPQVWDANRDFAWWQIAGHWREATTDGPGFVHPLRALLADFGLLAAYGYLLAFGVSWAFARIAQLRRVAMLPNRMLNFLGMAACVAVLADVAENVLTALLLLVYPSAYIPALGWLLGLGVTVAAPVKWAGLAGSAALVVWGGSSRQNAAARNTRASGHYRPGEN